MSIRTYIHLQELIDATGAGYMPAPVDFDECFVPEGYIEFVPPTVKDPALHELKYVMRGGFPEFFHELKSVPSLMGILSKRLSEKTKVALASGVVIDGLRFDCTAQSLRRAGALCTLNTENIYYKNGGTVLKVKAELFREYTAKIKNHAQKILNVSSAFSGNVEFAWSPEHAVSLYEKASVTLQYIETK